MRLKICRKHNNAAAVNCCMSYIYRAMCLCTVVKTVFIRCRREQLFEMIRFRLFIIILADYFYCSIFHSHSCAKLSFKKNRTDNTENFYTISLNYIRIAIRTIFSKPDPVSVLGSNRIPRIPVLVFNVDSRK